MKFLKVSCLALCALIKIGVYHPVHAESLIQPFYTYTDSVTVGLSITSSGTATSTDKIIPNGTNKTTITVYLEQYKNSAWIVIATWTGSNASGTSSAGGTKSISSGYSYRVRSVGKIYNSSGTVVETVSATSATKTR